MREIERMALMLQQMAEALVKTADLIEEADREAAGLFDLKNMNVPNGSKRPPGHASPVHPRRWPPPPPNPGFDGVDNLPEGVAYGPVKGHPFIPGPGEESPIHPSDVDQGYLGDCYFLSALAALANTERGQELIANNIRRNPDSLTYTVYLYERDDAGNFVQVPVVVSPDFPLDSNGNPVFAGIGDTDGAEQNELWVMLYEKAYAQHMGGYDDIQAGWGAAAMETLTGISSEGFINPIDLPIILDSEEMMGPGSSKWIPNSIEAGGMTIDEFADRFDAGDAITVGTWPLPRIQESVDLPEINIFGIQFDLDFDIDINPAASISPLYKRPDVVGGHEYYITDVNRATNEVTIRNPWGWDRPPITISYEEFQRAFPFVSVNPILPARP